MKICLWGNYVYELVSKGSKMPQNKNIYVQKELKRSSLSWIMGAVLYKTEQLTSRNAREKCFMYSFYSLM